MSDEFEDEPIQFNYRVVKHTTGGVVEYMIHEAHYEDDECIAICEDPVFPVGGDLAELRQEIEWMLQALDLEVMEWKEEWK